MWRALALPNFAGARLHGFLDGSAKAPAQTVTTGTGDAARIVSNPDYEHWWTLDKKGSVGIPMLRSPRFSETLAC